MVPGKPALAPPVTRAARAGTARNTFPSGVNRELASDYHGFVAGSATSPAVEAAAAGTPLSDATWRLLCAMTDVMAALVDERPAPRQGDSDEGRVVLLDPPEHNRWPPCCRSATPSSAGWTGGPRWRRTRPAPGRRAARPPGADGGGGRPQAAGSFADAGITIIRTGAAPLPASGAALTAGRTGSVDRRPRARGRAVGRGQVRRRRHPGRPGTYCYHGEPQWRQYFQSTIGHNTVEVDGQWQSLRGGAFLWLRHARAYETAVTGRRDRCQLDGRARRVRGRSPPAVHRRSSTTGTRGRSRSPTP